MLCGNVLLCLVGGAFDFLSSSLLEVEGSVSLYMVIFLLICVVFCESKSKRFPHLQIGWLMSLVFSLLLLVALPVPVLFLVLLSE